MGDLVALSDRDNVETNVTWTFWPEGAMMGLSVDEIVPFLKVRFSIEEYLTLFGRSARAQKNPGSFPLQS